MELNRYIGNREFYKNVKLIALPMIIQQGITNLVSLLDNIMVGRLGTAPMSGVAVVNQLIFVYNIMIFGGLAGASIFGAQYFGNNNKKEFQHTVWFRFYFALIMAVIGIVTLVNFGGPLSKLYLKDEEALTALPYAEEYIKVIVWSFFPFAMVQCIAGSLRDTSETITPMQASVLAIFTNLVLNYLLIYGKLGMPEMGISGAALATTIARYVELAYILIKMTLKWKKFSIFHGIKQTWIVPGYIFKKTVIMGTPLFLNEALWSVGMAIISICYAKRGLNAVAATNINSTVWNLFGIVLMSMGNTIGIMSGQKLGAGRIEEAKDTVRKMLFLTTSMNILIGLAIILTSGAIPLLYKTEPEVRRLASELLILSGIFLPLSAYVNGTYFTLRSGGKTVITFLFDCVYTWVVCIPLVYVLSTYTSMPLVWMYACVQLTDSIKALIGTLLVRSGMWAKQLSCDN